MLKPRTMLDETVIDHGSVHGGRLRPCGKPAGTYPEPESHRNRVGVAGHAGPRIGEPCDGVELFALFALFILAFPGPWLKKLGFIPLGILILHGANIGRVVVLARIQATSPEWLEFNHDYTITIPIYGLVCAVVPLDRVGSTQHTVNARRMTSQGSPQEGLVAGVGRGGWRCFWRCRWPRSRAGQNQGQSLHASG